MQADCSVTFEFEERPPVTWRGKVDGGSAAPIVRRATEEAQNQLRPRGWSSMVCVILSRDGINE